MLRAARRLAHRARRRGANDLPRRPRVAAGIRATTRRLIVELRDRRDAAGARRRRAWSTPSTASARPSPSAATRSRACSTRRGGAACRSSCTPSSSPTAAARRSPPPSARCRPIISNTLDEDGAAAMAKAGAVAVLLPGAFYTLRETQAPPVALLRQHGVAMAVATDCNPGTSPLTSLLLALNMAATLFRLTVEECLARRDPQRRARARARAPRSARWRPARRRRSGDLGHRAAGRTGLSPRLQSAASRVSGGADDGQARARRSSARRMARDLARRAGRARPRTCGARWRRAPRRCSASSRAASRSMASTPASASSPACASPTPISPSCNATSCCRHAAGVGEPTSVETTRLMMALKLASLAQGASGVRPETLRSSKRCWQRGLTPVVPAQGSVGASGDLAPLAHMAAAMIGVGEARLSATASCRRPRRSPRPASRRSQLRAEGGAGAAQRHAILHRLCAGRPVRSGARVARRAGRRRAVDRRGARLRHAVRSAHPCLAPPSRPDRRRPFAARADGRQRDPRLACPQRSARAGPLLPALPAAGDGRLPRPAAPGGRDARRRGQRRLRQSADLRRDRRGAVGRQFPRRAGRLRRRHDRARDLRDRLARRAARRDAGRSRAVRPAGVPDRRSPASIPAS